VKGLPNLIRLHRWHLDERRKNLVELERLAAELRGQRRQIDEDLEAEKTVAGSSVEAGMTYGDYVKAMIERREKLGHSIAEVEKQIERASEEVMEAFQEVKRYELAQAHRERLFREKEARLERLALDEMGVGAFRRRASE
jgi:flagellar export protein FliJ